MTIVSFKDEAARRWFLDGVAPRRVGWTGIKALVVRKLDVLEAAHSLDDLRSPPGNHLEALKGDRRGQHSIRVNGQWRVCFVWKDGNAHDVEIVDYH